MEKFYCIKCCNQGVDGYVVKTPTGIMMAPIFIMDCLKFSSYQQAQEFIREHDLEKNGIKAYILDNDDIIKQVNGTESTSAMKKSWAIVDESGDYVHYEPKQEAYFFDKQWGGACSFEDQEKASEFIQKMKVDFPDINWTPKVIDINMVVKHAE
jgi:hypothetical protein